VVSFLLFFLILIHHTIAPAAAAAAAHVASWHKFRGFLGGIMASMIENKNNGAFGDLFSDLLISDPCCCCYSHYYYHYYTAAAALISFFGRHG